MRDFLILFVHLIVTAARLARPGGVRSVVAESVLVRHQLLVLNRGRKRAPKLRTPDRIIAGLCTFSCAGHTFSVSHNLNAAPAEFAKGYGENLSRLPVSPRVLVFRVFRHSLLVDGVGQFRERL